MALARTLFAAGFLGGSVVVVGSASLSLAVTRQEVANLPAVTSVLEYTPPVTSTILASDGSVLGRFADQDRTMVSLDSVPPLLAQAFVSAEDRNFWHHRGVDPFAAARAMVANFSHRGSGRRQLGASTITQQVVKNLLVGDEASLKRKLREALLALRVEKEIGKRRVLEIYLNQIYLGVGAYGVASAAQAYFGKPMSQIDVAEMAFLGGLPKGPANYDPLRRPDAARARRAYVIGRMLDDGAITQAQASQALAEPLPQPQGRGLGGVADSYFAEEARREVVSKFGTAALYHRGLTIHTTMEPALQAIADHVLREGLVDYDRRHGWRGVLERVSLPANPTPPVWQALLGKLDPPAGAEDWDMALVLQSGRDAVIGLLDGRVGRIPLDALRWARPVLSDERLGPPPRMASDILRPGDVVLVQAHGDGASWDLRQIPEIDGALVAMDASTGRVLALSGGFSHERSSFDRVSQSLRQPGSTFKPFIYLTAFQHGYDPTSPVLDSPIALDVGPGLPRWEPGADGGRGWGLITARRALENSRNMATVRLVNDLGLDAIADTAKRFGIYEQIPNAAAALGALEVTDLQMTAAYAMLANGGFHVSPNLLDEVDGPDGAALAKFEAPTRDDSTRVADPLAVAQLTSVLQGVVKRGTAAGALAKIDLPLAGKTGTTNNNLDAWFVGYTPTIVVGVHVGFDRPAPLGADEMGARAAAPIFGAFMQRAAVIHPPPRAFPLPQGAKSQRVDPLTGEMSKTGIEEVVRDDGVTKGPAAITAH